MGSLLILHLLMVTSSPDVQRRVELIERPGWHRHESALVEALRIYTSDLKAAIHLKTDEARNITPETQVRAAQDQCSSKVSLVAWFSGSAKEPTLQILHCATLFVDQVPCPRHLAMESLAQTLALKIRALLAQEPGIRIGDEAANDKDNDDDDEESSLLDALPDDDDDMTIWRPGFSLNEPYVDDEAGPPPPSSKKTVSPTRPGVEAGAGYLAGTTSGFSDVRQGASMQFGLAWPNHGLAVALDGALTTSVVREDIHSHVSLAEFPVGLTLSVRWQNQRWLLACGPRVSLHFVQAEAASPDGRLAESWKYSVGLGASEQVRYDLWGPVGLQVALTNELMIPHRRYTVAGQEMAGSGLFQWAASTGLVYRWF